MHIPSVVERSHLPRSSVDGPERCVPTCPSAWLKAARLLHKLDMVLLPTNAATTSSDEGKGSTTQAVVVPTKATDKRKATSTTAGGAAESTDCELSDYKDAVMAE